MLVRSVTSRMFMNNDGIATTTPVMRVANQGVRKRGWIFENAFGSSPSRLMLIQMRGCPTWNTSKTLAMAMTALIAMKPLSFVRLYGGFIQVGVGYFLLMSLVLGVGYDLIKANAVKNLIVFLYAIFALLVFIINGQVNWLYGLLLSIGSVIGALIASYLAVKKGAGFIRAVIVVSVILTILQVSGLVDFSELFKKIL